MLMPTCLSIVLPIAAFAGTVFVYNELTNDREIVVLAAAGLSPLRLATPALVVAVATTALTYLMTLYLVPMSYRGFKELQFQIRHNFDHLVLREGEFRSFGDGRSEEHTSELQSLMRSSYAVFCLKKKKIHTNKHTT